MRDVFALPTPRPFSGWGFSFSKRIAAAAMLIAAVAGAAPAQAAPVTVTLRLSAGVYTAAFKTCAVTVESGADGVSVLSAAVTQRCIASYEASAARDYIRCVDPGVTSICEQGSGLVTFWAVYEDGLTSEKGIAGFHAAAGKELGLSYTNFLTCPLYPDCLV